MANQILNGTHAHKIANIWRLEARLDAIEQWLHTNRAIIFHHVKREGNKVTDLISNLRVDSGHTLLIGALHIIQNHDQNQECKTLVQRNVDLRDASV